MLKNYIGQAIDLTGDRYLNPTPAIYDNGVHNRNVSQITSIAIHHDASPRPHDYDSRARYQSEAEGHYNRLGPGLQYHVKIDNVGQIFYIRPFTTWLYSVGTAENVTCLAICLDGNFENQQPTREQLEALYQLLENLCEQHPEFPATWPDVRPHQDYSSTACCGANLRSRIYPIQSKATAADHLLNQGEFDWPSLQPDYKVSVTGTLPSPLIPTPPVGSTTEPTPSPTPAPTPAPVEQAHDYGKENNDLLKQLLSLVQSIWDKLKSIFK